MGGSGVGRSPSAPPASSSHLSLNPGLGPAFGAGGPPGAGNIGLSADPLAQFAPLGGGGGGMGFGNGGFGGNIGFSGGLPASGLRDTPPQLVVLGVCQPQDHCWLWSPCCWVRQC